MGHKYVKEDETFNTSQNGTVPKPTAQEVSDNKILRADGTWVAQSGGGGGIPETDITSIIINGSTNDTGSTIAKSTYFYLNDVLVRALTDIANGATLTENTNYSRVTAGALNELSNYLKITDIVGDYARGSSNWNSITKPGMYYMNTWAGSGGTGAFPVQATGTLIVLNNTVYITQIVFCGSAFGYRTYDGSAWSAWEKVSLS